MFTFALWKGGNKTTPPQKLPDMEQSIIVANHFLSEYSKVQIILNGKVVVKELTNPTLEA